ncbi:MAG: hypothetical protein KI786_03325 [Mameliella sp.]|uniref:hypothetical protein n=1 Tax=Gilvibacter sp. TaxID=2729997 RepID=UPI0025BC7B0B|nr:hypothetical protein [Gilvibacter sp.]MBV6652757.1 hypothetical protein [Phaeodactylibacter sp.]NQX78879.1 hypothetical protein [Gilvibacter sp.]NRA49725.1 hypothetical protein [Phaeodactylibacter sp.]
MLKKLSFLLALFLTGSLTTLVAQTASLHETTGSKAAVTTKTNSLLNMDSESWSLYADEENNLYYVDFATLSVNLNDIVVTRDDGEVVLREQVFDLPVDTIYEIDFNQYGKGNYTIELRSFTDVIRRKVKI